MQTNNEAQGLEDFFVSRSFAHCKIFHIMFCQLVQLSVLPTSSNRSGCYRNLKVFCHHQILRKAMLCMEREERYTLDQTSFPPFTSCPTHGMKLCLWKFEDVCHVVVSREVATNQPESDADRAEAQTVFVWWLKKVESTGHKSEETIDSDDHYSTCCLLKRQAKQ